MNKFQLIDGNSDNVICTYKALSIALRDCGKKNKADGSLRYYVKKPNGRCVTAKGE